jgi:hypothetical protein
MESLMNRQGCHFSQAALDRIVDLLHDTDLSLTEIALRMRCSRSAVNAVNGKYRVRHYEGRRSHWRVGSPLTAPAERECAEPEMEAVALAI